MNLSHDTNHRQAVHDFYFAALSHISHASLDEHSLLRFIFPFSVHWTILWRILAPYGRVGPGNAMDTGGDDGAKLP
jgi:hypothetical protein